MEFLDKQNQMWLDSLEEDIKAELYQNWIDAQSDEGQDYLEYVIMSYASEDMQKLYNEHYGYTMEDDFFFVTSDQQEAYKECVLKQQELDN